MMAKENILLMVRMDVYPEIEADWNGWYNTQHLPSRLNLTGFVSARRFVVHKGEPKHLSLPELTPEPKYLTLCDLTSTDVLQSEAYLKILREEASLPADSFEAITPKLPHFSRGVYKQIYPERGEYKVPDTDVIFAVGHDMSSTREEEYNAWYNTEHIPAMNRVPGFVTARRFKMVLGDPLPKSLISTPSHPKYLQVYDLESEEVLRSDIFMKERSSPWGSWVRSWLDRRLRILGRRIFP
jgi:hypothetical protein